MIYRISVPLQSPEFRAKAQISTDLRMKMTILSSYYMFPWRYSILLIFVYTTNTFNKSDFGYSSLFISILQNIDHFIKF